MPIQILPEPINNSYSYSYNNSYSYNGLSYTYSYSYNGNTNTNTNTKPYYTKSEVDRKIALVNNKLNSLLAKYNKLVNDVDIVESRINKLHEI